MPCSASPPSGAAQGPADTLSLAPEPTRDTARAMSEENVEIVRRGWEAFEGGDLSSAIALMTADMVTYVAPPIPSPVRITDRRGLCN